MFGLTYLLLCASVAMGFSTGKRLTVYHTSWSSLDIASIPYNSITDVTYAFFILKKNAAGFYVPSLLDNYFDDQNLQKFMKAKQTNQFKFGIAIGGFTDSAYFSDAMLTSDSRTAFVNTLLGFINQYPGLIDRWDFDWEYPSNDGVNYGQPGNTARVGDSTNFGLFLGQLRTALNSNGFSKIELSAAIAADPNKIYQLPLTDMASYLDLIAIMTYDFLSSAWGPGPASHQSNLYSTPYAQQSVDMSVKVLLIAGIPASRIQIGVPYYSRQFANTAGLLQPSSGVYNDATNKDGMCNYNQLPFDQYTVQWDPQAQATFMYNSQTRVLHSFDGLQAIQAKTKYIWDIGLGGVIVWETSGDFPITHPLSLTAALANGLGTPQ